MTGKNFAYKITILYAKFLPAAHSSLNSKHVFVLVVVGNVLLLHIEDPLPSTSTVDAS